MAGDLETDIDSFIKNQKQKLAQERSDLVQDEPVHERRTWEKPSPDRRVTVAEEVQRAPTPEETGLPIGRNSVEARQKKLQDERRKEYNDMIHKKPVNQGSRRLPTPDGRSLPVGQGQDETAQRRKVLQEERTRDYNNMIKKHTRSPRRPPTPDETGLQIGQYAEQRKKLEEDRLKEYNELLEKQKRIPTVKFKEEPDIKLIKDENEAVPDPRIQERLNELSRIHYERSPNNRYNDHVRESSRVQNDGQYERSPGYPNELSRVQNDRHYERSPGYGHPNELSRVQNDRNYEISPGYGHPNEISRVQNDRHYERSTGYGHPNELSRVQNDRHYERSPGYEHPNEISRESQFEGSPMYDSKGQRLYPYQNSRENLSYPRAENSPEKKGILTSRKENLPPKPSTPDTFLSKLGTHEREKKRLNDERKKEYNKMMNDKIIRGHKIPGRDGESMAVPGLVDKQTEQPTRSSWETKLFEDFLKQRYRRKKKRESKEKQFRQDSYVDSKPYSQEKSKKRNEEYNEFLRQKEQARGNKNDPPNDKHGGNVPMETRRHQTTHQVYYGSIPGLTHSRSADERERKLERNLEYREVVRIMNMSDDEGSEEPDVKPYSRVSEVAQEGRYGNSPPGEPRAGWTTPTYEEILQKKQQEENRYRRFDDPELSRPGERGYGRQIPNNRSEGVLDDDNWLRSQQMKDELYNSRPAHPNKSQISPRRPLPEPVGKPRATLLIGHEETTSAKRRRKDAYRHELEQQIQEHQDALKWEKTGDWRVNATGFLDPEKHPDRLRGLPASDSSHNIHHESQRPGGGGGAVPAGHLDYSPARTRPVYNNNAANPYFGALDQLRNRTDALLGRRGDLSFSGGGNGILERGWEGLYDRPRHAVNAPAPAAYENSSYLTNGVSGGYNAVNEAYHLAGLRNPLDGYNDLSGSLPYDTAHSGGQLRFEEPSLSPRKGDDRHHVLPFPVGDDSPGKPRQKQDTQSYQVELQKQIEDKKLKKKREKVEQDRLDRKWEEENKNYNPFGRGGGGAPLKDSTGHTLADLRQLKITGPEAGKSPRAPTQPVSPRLVAKSPPPLNVSGEATYARGGHGIFGVPKTYEEKTASDRYKDELRQQIEDKRSREALEKQRLLEEEERENRRLADQQQRIQQEFDEEVRKKRAKEEEARKRNEELQRLTQEKKKAAEHARKEQDEKRVQELRDRQDEERKQRDTRERERAYNNERSSSPPVPAVKTKLATEEDALPVETANLSIVESEQRGKSPVVPALRHKSSPTPPPAPPSKTQPSPVPQQSQSRQPRASSADVLNQLATMRKQLQNERARVENALDRQKNDYEVFDPRLVQRPPVVPAVPRREHEFEIFEGARNRAPVSVRRPAPPDSADPAIVNEFNYLKNKGSTDSRREVRQTYPESPRNSNDLESQQLELIKRQEEHLKRPPQRSIFEEALPRMAPRDLGQRKESPQAMLQSESAFIDVNRVESFPEDFDDLPRRNNSARHRRRQKPDTPPRYNPDNYSLKSNVSLDVDRLSKKNEDRLKRLKQMTGDEVSLADPDDVLDRFMARQRHNRPPSGQTLKDDTWMRADSRY